MGVEHIAYEPFSNEALEGGTADVVGGSGLPRFDLSGADRIACFGADFLGTWLAPTEMSAGFAASRDIDEHHHAKFSFVGPRLSLTGANADEWIQARAGTEGHVALAVAGVVAAARGVPLPAGAQGFTPESVADAADVSADEIRTLGEELAAASTPVAIPPGVESQGASARQAGTRRGRASQPGAGCGGALGGPGRGRAGRHDGQLRRCAGSDRPNAGWSGAYADRDRRQPGVLAARLGRLYRRHGQRGEYDRDQLTPRRDRLGRGLGPPLPP